MPTPKVQKTTKKKTAKRKPGRPWTPEGRRLVIPIRVNDAERDLLRAASKTTKTPLATMVRVVAVEHARRVFAKS